ncbi:MAG TPA: glycosyltransferase family 2 protein [Terracidiphilus sp.]
MPEIRGLVSVTVPFHDREEFLADTIESVLAQTYPDWELLLVDDGSNDRSSQIARDYAARFPGKMRYLEFPGHANRGVTRARNLGAASARGEYLAFLDSDDIWLPNKLEHQLEMLRVNPTAGLCYGPSEYWFSWDKNAKDSDSIPAVAPPGRIYSPPFLFVSSHPFGAYGAPCPSSFLLRRSAFDLVGGFVEAFKPGAYQLYEDTAFLSKLYLKVPVYVTDTCTDRYRCHPDSIWFQTQGTIREERERRFYFRWLDNYLRSHAVTDPAVWTAMRRKGWFYRLPLPASVTGLFRRANNRLSR